MNKNTGHGRCHPCRNAYIWERKSHRTLQTVRCPACHALLDQTTRAQRAVPWTALTFSADEEQRMKDRHKALRAYRRTIDAWITACHEYCAPIGDAALSEFVSENPDRYGKRAAYWSAYYEAQRAYSLLNPRPDRP